VDKCASFPKVLLTTLTGRDVGEGGGIGTKYSSRSHHQPNGNPSIMGC
jgi:hypothetical protein